MGQPRRPTSSYHESRADAVARGIATGVFTFPGVWFVVIFLATRLGLMIGTVAPGYVLYFAWLAALAVCSRIYQQAVHRGATLFAAAFLLTSIAVSVVTLWLISAPDWQ